MEKTRAWTFYENEFFAELSFTVPIGNRLIFINILGVVGDSRFITKDPTIFDL